MLNEVRGLIKRQYLNLRIFKAYPLSALLKESFLLPKDLLSTSGHSSSVLNIALFVTARCNARCAMCNITDILDDKTKTDMPMERIECLLDDVAPFRPSIILFGGEPFVRKDIVDIVKAVKKRRLSVGLFTNGLLLNEDRIDGMIRERLDFIAFSLQGTKDVHDKILSVPGAYDKITGAIRSFAARKPRPTKVVTHTTICEYNLNDLRQVASTALGMGVDLVRFGHPTFYSSDEQQRADSVMRSIFTGPERARATSYIYDIRGKEAVYLQKIQELKREFGSAVSFSPELSDEELESWYAPEFASRRKCLFVWRGLFIHPNGDVYPCESISYKMGNVFEEGFAKVWNNPRYRQFRTCLKKGLLPACARCCKL